ncbi:MAG TPA: hypothetical protein VKG63_09060 [Steroidobacteraceae bacterium]|nr:hypothetical protein [Steroidobacteraceae bacterium]
MAAALDADPSARNSVFSRSAVTFWRIAGVITGRLHAHPYISYQRGPSALQGVRHRIRARLVGGVARLRDRSLQTFADELHRVARELDDARALTWSAELSDTLGRAQTQIRTLLRELDGARAPRSGARAGAALDEPASVPGNWPYLAF